MPHPQKKGIRQLSHPSFQLAICDTLEEFPLAEALALRQAWKLATPDHPCTQFTPDCPAIKDIAVEICTNPRIRRCR
jgi:hypothetical protein